jgi:hypothetical protein
VCRRAELYIFTGFYAVSHFYCAECHYGECHYAERPGANLNQEAEQPRGDNLQDIKTEFSTLS